MRESTPFHDSRIARHPAECCTDIDTDDPEDDGFAEFFIPVAAAIIGCLTLIIWAIIHA